MKQIYRLITVFIIILVYINGYSCTSFLLNKDGELIFGKNLDWYIDYGLVMVNKKNVEKTASVNSKNKPASWVSKYGSLTFNQYGREFPNGGINEKGLVVEVLWLDNTSYPAPDSRDEISNLQWIQYQLDNCKSVKEVIETDSKIRITQTDAPDHFLVADKEGNTVSIEFVDGKLVYHTGSDMPQRVLTNNTYEQSIEYYNNYSSTNQIPPQYDLYNSFSRFVTTCKMLEEYNPTEYKSAVDYGFKILDKVSQKGFTMWSTIYDIKNSKVYFKTDKSSKIKIIDLNSLNYSCDSKVKVIDVNADYEGEVNKKMINYSYELNKDLIYSSFKNLDMLKHIPNYVLDYLAEYPEKFDCAD